MASFSVRTLDFRRGGREYKVHIRVEEKQLEDILDRLCERFETSQADQDYSGIFTLTARRVRWEDIVHPNHVPIAGVEHGVSTRNYCGGSAKDA